MSLPEEFQYNTARFEMWQWVA